MNYLILIRVSSLGVIVASISLWLYLVKFKRIRISKLRRLLLGTITISGFAFLIVAPALLESSLPKFYKVIILLAFLSIYPILNGVFYLLAKYIERISKYEHLGTLTNIISISLSILGFVVYLLLNNVAITIGIGMKNSDVPNQIVTTNIIPEEMACDDDAFIYCGFRTKRELTDKITSGDGKHNDIKKILGSMGIYAGDLQSSRAEEGFIKTDGTVWVGSEKIAEGIVIGQRQQVQGTHPWVGLYWYSPYTYNLKASAQALIYRKDGKFIYGLVNSCGCPVLRNNFYIPPTTLTVTLKVKGEDDSNWSYETWANPGDIVSYLITIKNNSEVTDENIIVISKIPNQTELMPDSYLLRYITGDDETDYSDYQPNGSGVEGGQGLGDLWPGQTVYLRFSLKIRDDLSINECSNVTLTTNVDGRWTEDVTTTKDIKVCPE